MCWSFSFHDQYVRSVAVRRFQQMCDSELEEFLPQLVQVRRDFEMQSNDLVIKKPFALTKQWSKGPLSHTASISKQNHTWALFARSLFLMVTSVKYVFRSAPWSNSCILIHTDTHNTFYCFYYCYDLVTHPAVLYLHIWLLYYYFICYLCI